MLCLCRPPIVSKMRSKSVISNTLTLTELLAEAVDENLLEARTWADGQDLT
jgi:hypothetical protein